MENSLRQPNIAKYEQSVTTDIVMTKKCIVTNIITASKVAKDILTAMANTSTVTVNILIVMTNTAS